MLEKEKMLFFKRFYLFIFLERGDKEGQKHRYRVAARTPATGDLAHNPDMCPDWESNWQPYGPQANTQRTEPYQSGQKRCSFN